MLKKILKMILLIIVIIFIIIVVNNLREANIIYTFSQKLDEYTAIPNFYAKYQENGEIKECWRKDYAGVTKYVNDENESKILYVDEEIIWILIEEINEQGELEKNATKQKNTTEKGIFVPDISDYSLYAENRWESIIFSLETTITEEVVDGEDCYKIYLDDEFIIYVNKETYMKKKEINGSTETTLLEYEFNCVADEDLELLKFIGYDVKIVE